MKRKPRNNFDAQNGFDEWVSSVIVDLRTLSF